MKPHDLQMSNRRSLPRAARLRDARGFSLLELLVSVAILSIVSATALEGVFRLTKVNQTVSNRSEMHAGVRNATELLQQEVGQAGRIALPNLVQLNAAVTGLGPATVSLKTVDASGNTLSSINPTDGLFVGEKLVIDTGDKEETVTVTALDTSNHTITGEFFSTHNASAPVNVYGAFSYGVVPKENTNGSTFTNGSTGSVLKLVGDINSDGKLLYVEYSCDTDAGNLYRRTMAYDATSKPAITADMTLLNNITANPDGSDCFTYQQHSVNNVPYVVDVAITLTVRTPEKDPITGLYQTETKALLNVSPRNVFNVWQLAGLGYSNRVQSLPTSVTTLMGLP